MGQKSVVAILVAVVGIAAGVFWPGEKSKAQGRVPAWAIELTKDIGGAAAVALVQQLAASRDVASKDDLSGLYHIEPEKKHVGSCAVV